MVEIVYNRNCVYQTAYHVIWCPKYRKRILKGEIAKALRLAITAICIEREWPILTLEIQPDHIHLFVTIPPSQAVADAVKILKGSTARKLFVHRNTLVYRLEKIKKLTGLDLREFDDAITFKVALMVKKYLTSRGIDA